MAGGQLKSSIPGLGYPSGQDDKLKTGEGFLAGRRRDDGAEGLWRIRNGLYDLSGFIKSHPGGEEWLQLTRGTDITEAFETHHLGEKAHIMLPKFYIRDAKTPRQIPLTFKPDGFFYKFKKRVLIALKDVNYHEPAKITNFTIDMMLLTTILLCILAAKTQHCINIASAALFFVWTTNISHNYLHMKDSFRVYYFDLSLWSSKEFRISHVLSHHMYTNTIWDMEIYCFEPFLSWYPGEGKRSRLIRIFSFMISPIVWTFIFLAQAVKRYHAILFKNSKLEIRDVIPYILPILMTTAAPSVFVAFKIWFIIILFGSFLFGLIGVNAGHHHPDIFHDGDVYRKDMDWGLLELDATRDRTVIDESLFLVLTHYGSHGLHHLLPTIDHAYLSLCFKPFKETCEEFGFSYERNFMSPWELVKGQFMQLLRTEVKNNARHSKRDDIK